MNIDSKDYIEMKHTKYEYISERVLLVENVFGWNKYTYNKLQVPILLLLRARCVYRIESPNTPGHSVIAKCRRFQFTGDLHRVHRHKFASVSEELVASTFRVKKDGDEDRRSNLFRNICNYMLI